MSTLETDLVQAATGTDWTSAAAGGLSHVDQLFI